MSRLHYWLGIAFFGSAYWIRGLFISPAPPGQRCAMGGPVHPAVHCPRYAGAGLWCHRHQTQKGTS